MYNHGSTCYTVIRSKHGGIMTLLLSIIITVNGMITGVSPQLVESIVEVESNFNPNTTGSIGEIGLMQIRKEYSQVGPLSLYEPELNIATGMKMLSKIEVKHKSKFGNHYYVAWNLGVTGAYKYSKKRRLSKFRYAKKTDTIFNKKVMIVAMQ